MKAIDQLRDVIAAEPESPAYRSGWGARIHGAERQDNPNPSGMDKAQWNKGWDAAEGWLCVNRLRGGVPLSPIEQRSPRNLTAGQLLDSLRMRGLARPFGARHSSCLLPLPDSLIGDIKALRQLGKAHQFDCF